MPVGPAGETPASDTPAGASVTAPRRADRRTWVLAGIAAALVAVLLVVFLVSRDDGGSSDDGADSSIGTASGEWLSGASGPGVVDGRFGDWRGRAVEIAGTWSDDKENMTQLWQLQPGFDYVDWDAPMDLAVGAIGADETWAQAAQGAYEDRWRETLIKARDSWEGRAGTLYIRFAHESNGNWYPWAVDADEKDDFIAAWQQFRELQQEIFPESQLVFCLNRESVGTGFDWRESFPGADYVDVFAVDYYNQYPYVDSPASWAQSMEEVDEWGAPKGLAGFQQFAESKGLPLAIPEWSGVTDQGDAPIFIREMHDFFAENGGSGPGELLYEILFNVDNEDYAGNFALSGDTRMPESAAAYREAWATDGP